MFCTCERTGRGQVSNAIDNHSACMPDASTACRLPRPGTKIGVQCSGERMGRRIAARPTCSFNVRGACNMPRGIAGRRAEEHTFGGHQLTGSVVGESGACGGGGRGAMDASMEALTRLREKKVGLERLRGEILRLR